jgi:hypothetical protein
VWHYSHRHRSLLDSNHPIPNGVWKLVFNAESGSLPGTAMSELLLSRGMLDPNDRPFELSGIDVIRVRIRVSLSRANRMAINLLGAGGIPFVTSF